MVGLCREGLPSLGSLVYHLIPSLSSSLDHPHLWYSGCTLDLCFSGTFVHLTAKSFTVSSQESGFWQHCVWALAAMAAGWLPASEGLQLLPLLAAPRALPCLGLGPVGTQALGGSLAFLTQACALQTGLGAALEGGDFLGVAVTPGAAGKQASLGSMDKEVLQCCGQAGVGGLLVSDPSGDGGASRTAALQQGIL